MKTYIALLRGLNVGGKNSLPMKELISILENLGAKNARTYIQSGNAVFESELKTTTQFPSQLAAEIKNGLGLNRMFSFLDWTH